MRITVLAGGIGAARFLRGLRAAAPDADVTVVGNTADDITLHGLRICPDLDTVMYTLGGGVHPDQGWGRAEETFVVAGELAAYGSAPEWFTLGDRDLATHVVRTRLLGAGRPLSEVTDVLCRRWRPGVRLLPMTDERVETHVVLPAADATDGGEGGGPGAVHFQEWWIRMRGVPDAERFEVVGLGAARPAPGVLEAVAAADVVVLAPSNPVVSLGPVLGVPGLREAVRSSPARVVGVSPIIGGAAVRGMAESCLRTVGVPASAAAVAGLYADLLDAWVVDPVDEAGARAGGPAGVDVVAHPALMTDLAAAAALAGTVLAAADPVATA
ncbi:MAG: 2-phospho-L-lactate transferase [Kineosporiaceae bacterium]